MNVKEIKKENIKHNLDFFRSFKKELTIMVKANAYGHGLKEIANILKCENLKLGVATIDEALFLRKYYKGKILIVEPLKDFDKVKGFEFCVDDLESFKEVINLGLDKKCYIKINIGMNRFGIKYDDVKTLKKVAMMAKKHNVKGLMTHFSYLDNEDYTQVQYNRFCKVRKFFPQDIKVSFGGSNVITKDFCFNECRVGIGFYGYENENVKPILTLKSSILRILELKDGEELGYGNRFISQGKTKVGVVAIGYGDGIIRALKDFYVYINGQKCDIIGNICMDCLFVDVTNTKAKVGDEVVFERADLTANHLNTISYEVLTNFSNVRGKTIIV